MTSVGQWKLKVECYVLCESVRKSTYDIIELELVIIRYDNSTTFHRKSFNLHVTFCVNCLSEKFFFVDFEFRIAVIHIEKQQSQHEAREKVMF